MSFKFVFDGDDGVIYCVTEVGELIWYRHMSRAAAPEWANAGVPKQIGAGWNRFTHVLGGGDGVIYAVEPTGALLWHRHVARTEDAHWVNGGAGVQIGSGWTRFTRVFSGGGGVIYGIDPAGDLWWHEHTSTPRGESWAHGGTGQKVGNGWGQMIHVFSGGHGVIYAVQPDGALYWYQHLSREGRFDWANGGGGKVVGSGWNQFSHVFSGGDGVIYVVTASGELRWYRHLAREGTFNWENGGSPRVIATGWGTPIADSPPAPVRDDGELRVIEELGLRATLPAGAIVKCDWRDARIVTNSGVEISLTVDSPIATLEGALQGIHQGWKRVLETLRYDTTADGWIVVVKMMRGSHGPVTGMTIRRRIAQMNVDIACEDNDGELDPSWVEAFAASLTALPGSIAEQVVPGTAPSLRAFIGSENWCARKTGVALWPDGLVQWTGPEYKTARGRFTQADESAVQALIERVRRSPCFAESGPNLGSSSPEFPRAIGIRIGDQWRDRGGPDVQQLVDDVTALTGWASALPPPPVYAAPGPWAPRERYAAPPPDAASLGEPPPGFTRLTGLDLDAKIPPADALVSSGWYGTSIDIRRSREPGDHWSIACTIDSPISTLDAAVSALVRENDRRKLQSIHRAEETSDGWVIFVTTTWDRSFASHAATVRRKLGRTTVDITADDRSVELPFIEALAKSLVLVPGGILEAPFPREEPVICASFGRGCWSGPGGGVALWSDGTAQYSGPRYRTVRGRFTKIDSALVAELHERIRTADCCVAPEDVRGPPLELRVRGDDGWKCCAGRDLVVRFGEVATLVGFARG